jgi:TolB protein
MRYILSFLVIVILTTAATAQAQTRQCKIAYVNGGDIWLMNGDGTQKKQLTTTANNYAPNFSPSGDQIAFHSNRDGNDEIYTMNIDGLGVVRITNNTAVDTGAVWSSDGEIGFTSTRDGNYEIYTMNVDGSDIVRITNNTAVDILTDWGTNMVMKTNRDGYWKSYVIVPNEQAILTDSTSDYDAKAIDSSTFILQSTRWDGVKQIALTDGDSIIQLTTDGGEIPDVWCPTSTNNPPIQDTSTITLTSYLDTITTQQRMQTNTMIFFGLLVVGFATLALVRRR